MSYLDWSIGGLVPSWIANVKWGFGGAGAGSGTSAGRADSTVTLHCATKSRDEIEQFRALMTPVFTNTNLVNGGTDLQVTPDGHILVITNGPYSWNGIISSVQFTEDQYATIDGEAAIEFDIILELQRGSSPTAELGCTPAEIVSNSCVLISRGFSNPVTQKGQIVDLGNTANGIAIVDNFNIGSFLFNWDGSGKIYVASSCDADITTDKIWADDELVLKTVNGSVTGESIDHGLGGPYPGAYYYRPLEITSILQAGIIVLNVLSMMLEEI